MNAMTQESSAFAPRPPCFLTIDVDSLWALRQCYGAPCDLNIKDPLWSEGVTRLLDMLAAKHIRAGFFIIAADLENTEKLEIIKEMIRQGHEIGNHSRSHSIGLTRQTDEKLREEIGKAQDFFEKHIGTRPVGFRSPGYDMDERLLEKLIAAGFHYDSSLLPSWWGPALRMADWTLARKIQFGKRQFGRFRNGFSPLAPFLPLPAKSKEFLEYPISVSPRLRLPVGAGYVFAAGFNHFAKAADYYRKRRIPFTYLIHAADATDLCAGDARVFPSRLRQPRAAGFSMPGERKREILERILDHLASNFEPRLLREGPSARIGEER